MDNRLYFVLGDLFANLLTGLLAALLCWWVIVTGWNMFLAMLLALALGVFVGLVLFFPLGVLFGAMEVMLPIMFTGMVSGMVVGMAVAMHPLPLLAAVQYGLVTGFICIVFIWLLNVRLRGVRTFNDGGAS